MFCRQKKSKWARVMAFLLGLMLMLQTYVPVQAANEINAKEIQPMDIVLVVDVSGSMKSSDKERIVLDRALQIFANIMPAGQGSRLGIICFNGESSVISVDAAGKPTFLDVDKLSATSNEKEVETNIKGKIANGPVTDLVKSVQYKGYTGMGNGLIDAVKLFEGSFRDDVEKRIVLFSDGVDEMKTQVKLQEALGNLADAKLWLSNPQHTIPVDIIAFNYLQNGKSSLGDEGMAKLNDIADSTGGTVYEIKKAEDITSAFVKILGLDDDIIEIPGVYPINVTPEVVEIDITVIEVNGSLADADIKLKDPNGNEVDLYNTDNIKYFRTYGCITLKMIKPDLGKWSLEIWGNGQVVINPIMYTDMHLSFDVITPSGTDTANIGDEVIVKAQIQGKNGGAVDASHYDVYDEASFEVVPTTGSSKKVYIMSYDPAANAFVGKFKMEKGVFDINVRVKTPSVEDTYTKQVGNGNHAPVALNDLGQHEVSVRKTIEISDIFSVVSDPDGDKLTASVTAYEPAKAQNCVDVSVVGDKIVVKGLRWNDVTLTVTFTDVEGESVDVLAVVHVRDWLLVGFLSAIPFLIALGVLIAMYVVYRNAKKLRGAMAIRSFSVTQGNDQQFISQPVELDLAKVTRGGKTNFAMIARAYSDEANYVPELSGDDKKTIKMYFDNPAGSGAVTKGLQSILVEGTPFGSKGIVIKLTDTKKAKVENVRTMGNHRGEYSLQGLREFKVTIQCDDGTVIEMNMKYNQSGGLQKRGGKKGGHKAKASARGRK